jgi:Plasmid recombination enzyme
MPHAIARIKKLKQSNLAGSEQHTTRSRETPNADPTQPNPRLIGTVEAPVLEALVRQRIGAQPIRKNAVWCVEMLLTVSPDYFRPDEPSRAGYWDESRLEQYQWAVQQWLSETYGDRIVRAELHLDEATPHIHAYLVPLDERGKLNCRGLFGSREKLRQFQDNYAKALEPLGVDRGIRGSRATHTAIQEYYAAVMQEPNLDLDSATIQHQLSDRRRLLKERNELEQTARALERENAKLQRQVNDLQRIQRQYEQSLVQVRALPLEQIAKALGLKPDAQSLGQWRNHAHTLNITGNKFYDWQMLKGGSGAIGLVMHVQQCDFKRGVVWLRDRFGELQVLRAVTDTTQEILQSEPTRQFVAPIPNRLQWERGRHHLTRSLNLPERLLNRLKQQGLVYANDEGQIVFVQRNLQDGSANGAVLYSPDNGGYEIALGSQQLEGWFYLSAGKEVERIVLVDNPIDAIAKYVLEIPEARSVYLAVTGTALPPASWLKQFSEVEVACVQEKSEILHWLESEQVAMTQQQPKLETWQQDLTMYLRHSFREVSQQEKSPKSSQEL